MSDPVSSPSLIRYSYKPLQGNHAFRILKLLPGDGEALVAELHHADLSTPNHQSYEALSYTWGASASPRALHCQGAILPITGNLDMALRSLRHADKPRWLWVDAVCIDQFNLEEKAHQVDFMRSVYSNSDQTVCYIGEEAHHSSQVIELAERVAGRVKEIAARSKGMSIDDFNDNYICELILDREPRFLEEAYSRCESELLMHHPMQSSLMQIITRPWFRRAWTIQEFIIPPQVIMRCGSRALSWYGLWYLASLAYIYMSTSQESDTCINQLRNRCRQRAKWRVRDAPHLQDVLHLMRTSLATQPEDKVYAVLALARDMGGGDLHVNYSEPVEATYSRFARCVVERGSAPRLLYDAGRNLRSGESTPGLPSWVPDWKTSTPFYSLGHVSWREGGYYSAGTTQQGTTKAPSVSPSGAVLSIPGIVIDEIRETGSSSEELAQAGPGDGSHQYQLQIEAVKIREFAACASRLDSYPTGEAIESVIEKTVIGDGLGSDYSSDLWAALATEIQRVLEDPLQITPSRNDTPRAIVWGDILWFLGWRRFALTKKGYVSLVHQEARIGDHICLVPGTGVPFVLHPVGDAPQVCDYRLVGEAYVHGVMYGEAAPASLSYWKSIRIH